MCDTIYPVVPAPIEHEVMIAMTSADRHKNLLNALVELINNDAPLTAYQEQVVREHMGVPR